MQIKFLLFQSGNKGLNQGDTLPHLLRTVHKKFVVTIFLEFLGFLTKRAADAFTELQLCPGSGCVEIGKALSAQVFHLCKKFLELARATGKFFHHGGFGASARLFSCFCSCHRV